MSTQRSVGLMGDSNQTMRVRSPMTLSGRDSSSREAKRAIRPNFVSRSFSR
jgi:hypothetical protein